MITTEQLKDVMERADALHRYLDIDKKKIELEEEELRTQAPDFWDDPEGRAGTDEEGERHTTVGGRIQGSAHNGRRTAVGF